VQRGNVFGSQPQERQDSTQHVVFENP
jgi:hypothetical protein